MSAFGGDDRDVAAATDERRHAQSRARPDHDHRFCREHLSGSDRPDIMRVQVRQGPGDSFEVVDKAYGLKTEHGVQFAGIGHPIAVGDEATPAFHRSCHAENGGADPTAISAVAHEATNRSNYRWMAGDRHVSDRAERATAQHCEACGRSANVTEECSVAAHLYDFRLAHNQGRRAFGALYEPGIPMEGCFFNSPLRRIIHIGDPKPRTVARAPFEIVEQ